MHQNNRCVKTHPTAKSGELRAKEIILMGKELLLEIGTEEIPAAFLPPAMRDMEDMLRREFAELVIAHGEIKTMATPRRLVVSISELAEKQEDRVIEKLGTGTRAA